MRRTVHIPDSRHDNSHTRYHKQLSEDVEKLKESKNEDHHILRELLGNRPMVKLMRLGVLFEADTSAHDHATICEFERVYGNRSALYMHRLTTKGYRATKA